jgi:two-component system chemotaxis response regulator CheY
MRLISDRLDPKRSKVGARVIFIDDEPLFLEGLRRALRVSFADVTQQFCTSAIEALSLLSQDCPTVIVCDWNMEAVDGLMFCELVRAEQREHALRPYILMLTGRSGTDDTVQALEGGADDFLSKPVDPRELHARIRVGLRLVAAEDELRRANRQLEQMAGTDPLTGLANRRAGERILQTEFARLGRGHQDVGVVMIDVDRFKNVNDEYGHLAGDAVLRELAVRVRSRCRSYDAVVRWGGEEILIVAPGITQEALAALGDRLLEAIAAPPVELEPDLHVEVTASLGAAWVPRGARDSVALDAVAAADAALLQAKRAGRARAVHAGLRDR